MTTKRTFILFSIRLIYLSVGLPRNIEAFVTTNNIHMLKTIAATIIVFVFPFIYLQCFR